MVTTAIGAERQYTLTYPDFYQRLREDPAFRAWFERVRAARRGGRGGDCRQSRPVRTLLPARQWPHAAGCHPPPVPKIEGDAAELAAGPVWQGTMPFPAGRWTRVLLLQQLLVEVFDLLDPDWCAALRRCMARPAAWPGRARQLRRTVRTAAQRRWPRARCPAAVCGCRWRAARG